MAFKQTHPGPDSAPKLYQVKGKRKIWASQWDPTWASFNAGDLPPQPGTGGWRAPVPTVPLLVPAVAIPGPQTLLTK